MNPTPTPTPKEPARCHELLALLRDLDYIVAAARQLLESRRLPQP